MIFCNCTPKLVVTKDIDVDGREVMTHYLSKRKLEFSTHMHSFSSPGSEYRVRPQSVHRLRRAVPV